MLLRPDLEALLAGPHKVAPNEAFFRLLVAVHQLDNLAIQWCGGKIGQLTPVPPSLPPQPPPHKSSDALCCCWRYSWNLKLIPACLRPHPHL